MAFNIKDFFKKKHRDDDFELDSENREEFEDIRMDSSNQFEKELGSIETDGKDTRKGRKIKSKYVIGIAMLVALFGIGAVVSNMLSGEESAQQQPKKIDNAAGSIQKTQVNVPKNYAELAKFEKQKQEEAAKAEAAKKKAEEEALAKKKAEEAERIEKERAEMRQRQVDMPRVNVNPNQGYFAQQAPAGPQISAEEQKANTSKLAFSLPGGDGSSSAGTLSSYIIGGSSSRLDMGASYRLDAGSIIPATLLNGITSDGTSSDVVAQVRQDVYDTLSGQHLLIPQGSKLLGKLQGASNRRMAVTFTRLILPDGNSIALPTQAATDKSGYAGMKDKYDTHDSTFLRGAFISGVMAYLSDVVDDKFDNKSYEDRDGRVYSSAIKDTVEKISDKVMERSDRDANRNPTVSIRPGFQFNVFINQDLQCYQYLR